MIQRTEKPNQVATCEANVGASTIASEKDMVYTAAYCPRLAALLLPTQKLFMKGNNSISPKVTMIICNNTNTKAGEMFSTKKKFRSEMIPASYTQVRACGFQAYISIPFQQQR